MFLQQFASKTIFLAYIRLLAILGGSQRGSDKAEALEEVFGRLDAHSQTEVEESLTWKFVDHATDLAQLKWSRVGEVQRSVTGKIWLSCLKRSVWKYILKERVEDNDDFS